MSYGQKPEKKLVCVAGSSLELFESWLVHQIFSLTHGAQSARGFGLARKFSKHVKLETEF